MLVHARVSNQTTLDSGAAPGVLAAAYLVVRDGEQSHVIDLYDGDAVTIRRSGDAEVPIDDKSASREHARVTYREGKLTLVDLGNRNGTLVSGSILRDGSRPLSSGEVFWIARGASSGSPCRPQTRRRRAERRPARC